MPAAQSDAIGRWLRILSPIGKWNGRLIRFPGMDGIYPALLQQGREIVIPCLIRIFRACLAMGYVPAIWRQVKVVFIPKPGRNSYTGPRDFRPIVLA